MADDPSFWASRGHDEVATAMALTSFLLLVKALPQLADHGLIERSHIATIADLVMRHVDGKGGDQELFRYLESGFARLDQVAAASGASPIYRAAEPPADFDAKPDAPKL